MSMSSSQFRQQDVRAEASSSRSPLSQRFVADGDSGDDAGLLSSGPVESDLGPNLTFKRKTTAPSSSAFSLPSILRSAPQFSSVNPIQTPSNLSISTGHRRQASRTSNGVAPDNHPRDGDNKDSTGVDWYIEGPGRRVGYDDLTAIDWIFEYAKERQRLRVLRSNCTGLIGQIRQFADASQIWIILIATGVAAGLVAAFIDVASDWLADLKGGICGNVQHGGKFYLSKAFCCWGNDELGQCLDWRSWAQLLNITSAGGIFMIDYVFFVGFSVLFAACASILVWEYAPYAKHSGIPEIKTVLGGFVIRRFMGAWTLVIKSIGLCLAVASGLWLGKEGPLVHVACCCANLITKGFPNINKNEARKREVLSAAAAAGISVAFGSPVGGVLFSLEQLSYYFPDKTMWQSFVCAMVAAVTLQAFNPFRTGKLVLYQVTYHSGWHGFEMVPFALLGILGGFYGGLFIKLNMYVASWRRSRPMFKGPVLEVIIISILTALINFPIKFMRAQASELVYTLFAECVDLTDDQLGLCKSGRANTGVIALLIVAAILGFVLASITFGLQIPAGIILPSIAIGALYGRAVGLILEVWQAAHPSWIVFRNCEPDIPCITPGTYAIVGAASALAGATRMTVSIVVIMFELTGALTYVLPIMIAVMLGKWIGDAIESKGIYEAWIRFNGYPFLDNRDDDAATVPHVPANQVYTRLEDLVVIEATGHTIQTLQGLLDEHPFRGFPIVDNPRDALLLGYISRTELSFALQSATATPRTLAPDTEAYFTHQALANPVTTLDLRPWMDQTPITLNSKASLHLSVNMFMRLGLRYVIFVERGVLKGLLTKKDVWLCLNGSEGVKLGEREERRGTGADEDTTGLLRDDSPVDDHASREGLG
ncbi:hypothetical protein FKW77_000207 [Venturia effusa]|uniref:Chloride channel protein n=1 Tax=Venturia effusa TaxID=50376 RepID=A0A517LGB8_9PEZI|nr:hypothetical protein FKW77_000207 [Venturia effusa]